jgi:hypothetical protein
MSEAVNNIRAIQTERDLNAAAMADDLKANAAEIAEHRKADMAGYVIVAWSSSNDVTVKTAIWDHARLPRQLVPEFIKEAVAQDITMRHVLNALAGAGEVGGAG